MVPKESPAKPEKPQLEGRARPHVTRKVAEEAATWITRLHGPSRTPDMEREFREWVARSPAHGYAFERCTDIWTDIKSLTPAQAYQIAAREMKHLSSLARLWHQFRWPLVTLLVVSALAISYAAYRWWAVDVYSTEVGGQQQVVLKDGTRLSLNTDTMVRVEFDATRRTVSLDAGEAMFDVAKDPLRPFVVRARGSEVIAVGTVFSVRVPGRSVGSRDAELSVALIEGEVTVQPESAGLEQGAAPQRRITLRAGERMRLAKPKGESATLAQTQIDHPPMEPLFAWKRGEVVFSDVSLGEAASEMNRYSRTPIVLIGDTAKLRVSGVFGTSSASSFAQALALLHGLEVRELEGRLELALPQ